MKFFIFCTLMFFCHFCQGQFKDKHALYGNVGVRIGNYTGLGISSNYIFKDRFSLSLSTSLMFRGSHKIPDDYRYGLFEFKKYETNISLSALMGYIININKKKTIRLNIRTGISLLFLYFPDNFVKDSISNDGRYTYDHHFTRTPGWVIMPAIEIPFSTYFGCSLSPYAILSKKTVVYGGNIGMIIGLLQ